ncbi:MAG: leucyl aminopeptidase family protein [Frankiaceae bacterium]|nr:leucyl aminopeptidase family protein [Arenimonas sp.]
MSLPACFVAAADPSDACPIVVVDRASYPAWLETQSEAARTWLQSNAFSPSTGACLLIPDASGRASQVIAAISDAADPFALSHLPMMLPAGVYQLDSRSPVRVDASAALLGWGLGAYKFIRYLSPGRPAARLMVDDTNTGVQRSLAILRSSELVRDLVNTPTEHMGPADLEAVADRLAKAHGGTLKVIAGDDLLIHNFPTIHAVGRASHRAPRLIELTWGNPAHPHVAIVGKGVCFDTGGLDIKTSDGMRNMKKDMGGAAHALGLAQLVMALELPIRMTLLVPAVENAIAGNAFRPGEIIVTRKGLSVEVDNTDAEGRLVLCDALAYASELKPELILDFATLTGAARVALGPDVPAMYSNDESLAADYLQASSRARDPIWRLPLWRPYVSYLNSNVADMSNGSPSRMAGSIVAALYLERFVADAQPWAHIDVYAWNDSNRPGRPAGGEAQGLRAALELLQSRYPL